MSVSREIVSQTIIEVARHENLILRRVGKVSFLSLNSPLSMPLGGNGYKSESGLGTAGARWLLDSIMCESDRTDLVFNVNNTPIGYGNRLQNT